MKILVFAEGTIIDDHNWTVVGNAVRKVRAWHMHGAEIVYLSSKRRAQDLAKVERVIEEWGLPEGVVYSRLSGEHYGEVAERVMPDIIVEDNCRSIGGEAEMTYPKLRADLKTRIKSIVVEEWGGIDHLPDSLKELSVYGTQRGSG